MTRIRASIGDLDVDGSPAWRWSVPEGVAEGGIRRCWTDRIRRRRWSWGELEDFVDGKGSGRILFARSNDLEPRPSLREKKRSRF